jgi:translation initiation factor IF-1
MKRFATSMCAALACITLSAAYAEEQKEPHKETHKAESHSGAAVGRTVEMQATVTALDLDKRMVTLKTDDGTETTLHVDERARNLKQVKVGDVVKVAYVQALAWQLNKSGATTPSVKAEGAAARTKEGEKPGGAAGRRITITAQIEAIDTDKGTVTLKGPEGNTKTVKAKNPANLKKVKVGDMVDITYTEAVALKVEPAAKQ